MARSTTPRPSSDSGRSQAIRHGKAADQTRGFRARRPTPGGEADPVAKALADHQRSRLLERQRQEAARTDAQQRLLRQQLALREAHHRQREEEAVRRTAEVQDRVARLEAILATGLTRSARIDLDSLRRTPSVPEFDPGELGRPAPKPVWETYAPRAGLIARLGGETRRKRREAAARKRYEQAKASWERAERERQRRLAEARRAHEARVAREQEEIERYHARVARVAAGLRDRDPKAVESFLRTVLRRVPLPAGFPRGGQVSHDRDQEWVVVRIRLPERDVVPDVVGYKYVEPTDELKPLPRSEADAAELYRRVLAQVALLTVRDVLDAEPRLSGVTCYGHVEVPTGAEGVEQRRLIGLTADRDTFERLDLLEFPAVEALLKLDATLSPDPYAYVPVTTL